jgi:alcohol dehydrogenase/L-iditol 2-dehydrogenase
MELGANATIDGNVNPYVAELGDGLGADVVIDAAGVSATLKLALELVRPGGQISKVGWGPQPMDFSLDPAVQKAVTIRGSFSHNWPIWERVIRLQATGQLDIEPVISKIAPLTEWEPCFRLMHEGEYVKAVLLPQA